MAYAISNALFKSATNFEGFGRVSTEQEGHEWYYIYDTEKSWTELRGGIKLKRGDGWYVRFFCHFPEDKDVVPRDYHLSQYQGTIVPNILSNYTYKMGPRTNADLHHTIRLAVLKIFREYIGREISIDDLNRRLHDLKKLDKSFITETMKMMCCRGDISAYERRGYVSFRLSPHLEDEYRRRNFLSSISDDMSAKSSRIRHLTGHPTTVGTYRERLLMSALQRIVPKRYQVSTGFIENCSRQLDIIVWDSQNFTALFQEEDFVVVPRAAVRAALEVKTKLTPKNIGDALNILWDAFSRENTAAPVFKGIFAFETSYRSDLAVAMSMKKFYNSKDAHGLIPREHWFIYSGVTQVCVPHNIMVRERYKYEEGRSDSFPQPNLSGTISDWEGDTKTPHFFGLLLSYLDLPLASKAELGRQFSSIMETIERNDLVDIYDYSWKPCLAAARLDRTLEPSGSIEYLERIHRFFAGEISQDEILVGMSNDPEKNGEGHVYKVR